jgi:hypothetical protein
MTDTPRDSLSSLPQQTTNRGRRLKRWAALLILLYVLLWAVTAMCGPQDVFSLFEKQYGTETRRDGTTAAVPIHKGTRFAGRGLDFWPDPLPAEDHWCCVGTPSVPAPFIVNCDFVWTQGGFSAGAGHCTFFWTPWGVYDLWTRWEWLA